MNMILKPIPKLTIRVNDINHTDDVRREQRDILHFLVKVIPTIKPFELSEGLTTLLTLGISDKEEAKRVSASGILSVLMGHLAGLATGEGFNTSTDVVGTEMLLTLSKDGKEIAVLSASFTKVTVSEDFDGCTIGYDTLDNYNKAYNFK